MSSNRETYSTLELAPGEYWTTKLTKVNKDGTSFSTIYAHQWSRERAIREAENTSQSYTMRGQLNIRCIAVKVGLSIIEEVIPHHLC
jgi:hypothetical protein